jgi:hypothetical protein
MPSLAEVCAAVYEITARPDLVVLTQQSVRAAIFEAHLLQDWPQDIRVHVAPDYVAPSSSATPQGKQFFEIALPPDLRKINRILAVRADPYSGQEIVNDAFVLEQGRQLVRYTGAPEPHTYRLLGSYLEVGTILPPASLQVEYFALPLVQFAVDAIPEAHSSWVLTAGCLEFVYLRAVQKVLRAIGMADDARALDGEAQLAATTLLSNYS